MSGPTKTPGSSRGCPDRLIWPFITWPGSLGVTSQQLAVPAAVINSLLPVHYPHCMPTGWCVRPRYHTIRHPHQMVISENISEGMIFLCYENVCVTSIVRLFCVIIYLHTHGSLFHLFRSHTLAHIIIYQVYNALFIMTNKMYCMKVSDCTISPSARNIILRLPAKLTQPVAHLVSQVP